MKIETEKFDMVRGLAIIDEGISNISVAINELSKVTDRYIESVGNEANNRVDKVLSESREVLENTTKNYSELSTYGKELQAYANKLKDFTNIVVSLSQDLNNKMKESQKDMEDHHGGISRLLTEIKAERVQVQEDRKQLKRELLGIEEETRLLNDRRETLSRGFEELRRLKNKKE